MADLIQFSVSPEQPRARDDVRAIIATHLALQRAKDARRFCVHLLASLGGLAISCVIFPSFGTDRFRAALLALWCAGGAAVLGAAFSEWKWLRREAQLLARNPGGPGR